MNLLEKLTYSVIYAIVLVLHYMHIFYRKIKRIHFHKWEYYEENEFNQDRVCVVCGKAEHTNMGSFHDFYCYKGLRHSIEYLDRQLENEIKQTAEESKEVKRIKRTIRTTAIRHLSENPISMTPNKPPTRIVTLQVEETKPNLTI